MKLSKQTPVTVELLMQVLEESGDARKLLKTLVLLTETEAEKEAREMKEFEERHF